MTLEYVASTYRVPQAALLNELQLPPQIEPTASLKTLATRARVSPLAFAERVQKVVATLSPKLQSSDGSGSSSWLGALGDQTLTALLVYGYPALGLTLLLGAIGLPLPDGIATTLAGSLASQGRIDWLWASTVAVIASVAGDAVGYSIGRLLNQKFLERHGRWIGYTPLRHARVQVLFDRWGMLTVFVTRTFISYLSSITSLAAGVSQYRFMKFLATALIGRVVWTAGYFGLGYVIGGDWKAATSFLTNFSALLLLLVVEIASAAVATGRFARS
jgi:membrane-associated protein